MDMNTRNIQNFSPYSAQDLLDWAGFIAFTPLVIKLRQQLDKRLAIDLSIRHPWQLFQFHKEAGYHIRRQGFLGICSQFGPQLVAEAGREMVRRTRRSLTRVPIIGKKVLIEGAAAE